MAHKPLVRKQIRDLGWRDDGICYHCRYPVPPLSNLCPRCFEKLPKVRVQLDGVPRCLVGSALVAVSAIQLEDGKDRCLVTECTVMGWSPGPFSHGFACVSAPRSGIHESPCPNCPKEIDDETTM